MSAPKFESLAESEGQLHEQAMVSTGLQDFGDPSYLTALRAYLGGLDDVGAVTRAGCFPMRNRFSLARTNSMRREQD
jgi:hypothetical protein